MTSTLNCRKAGGAKTLALSTFVATLTVLTSTTARAQEAIGVPFIGSNHLSFYVTELSRDGIGKKQAAVFGGVYGRRFGNRQGPMQVSMILRAGARGLEGTDDGIVDAGATLALTRALTPARRLTVTGAAGMGAVVWGQAEPQPGNGRVSIRAPLTAGMAYDLRLGAATIAPFLALTGVYSSERDYVDDVRVATDSGWRVGHSAGVSVRFKEAVLSVSGINRERGLPNTNRAVFAAGISW